MSLFKKITESVSKGVSTATEKAQQTVEITRLHAQISGKRKEIDKIFAAIGESVYKSHELGSLHVAESDVLPLCLEIDSFRREIEALDDRVKELRNEKDCVCGRRVPYETKFCPHCGNRFPEPVVVEQSPEVGENEGYDEAEPPLPPVPPEPVQPVICFGCGREVEADARFCPSCGHPADRPHE